MTSDNACNETRRTYYIVSWSNYSGQHREAFRTKGEAMRCAERLSMVEGATVGDVTEVEDILRTRVAVIQKGGA